MLVDFVRQHEDVGIFCKHVGKGFQLVVCVDAARRVRRRAEQQHACARCDCCLKLLGRDFEVLFHAGWHSHCLALGEFHHFHIAYPCRSGDDHLVAGVDCGEDHIAQRLFCAARHHNLFGSEVETVLVFHLCGNCLAKGHVAGNRCVEREVFVDGFLGGFLDGVRGVEVGFAHRKVDHVDSLSLQFVTLLRHRQCC